MKEREDKDIIFIIDGNAGRLRVERILSKLRKYSRGSTFIVTRKENELAEIFVGQGNGGKVYVAVGGDETVRKVMKHILSTDHLLGIVPVGSRNGFARQLGIRRNIRDCISILKHGEPVSVDVIEVNGCCYGANQAGLGFDAGVAYYFGRLRFHGLLGYVLASIQTLWNLNLFYARILGQSIKEKGVYWMIAIAGQYGDRVRIASGALCNDGEMDIVLVKPFPMVLLPFFLCRLFTARLKPSRYVKYVRTAEPVLISYTKTKFHIDGDPIDDLSDCITDEQLKIRIIQKAIQVILPVKAEKE